MDENLTRGYCQLRSGETPPRVEIVSSPPPTGRGRYGTPRSHVLPPLDTCRFVYIALLLCGAGFLLPYNSFITAVDYYQAKYPKSTIIFDMSLTYIVAAFIGVILNNALVEKFSLRLRVTVGYVLSFIMLLLIAVFDVKMSAFDAANSYRVTLIAVAIVALGCTVQQSSFYGYTSMLPPRYTQAVMTGESAAGLIVSVNRIATKLLMSDVEASTLLFFILSIIFVVVCCCAFHVTRHSDFVQFYVNVCETSAVVIDDDQRAIMRPASAGGTLGPSGEEVDILEGSASHDGYGVLVIQSPNTPPPPGMTLATGLQANRVTISRAVQPSSTATTTTPQGSCPSRAQWLGRSYRKHISLWDSIKRGLKSRQQVARSIWQYMVSIGIVYFVTLCLFPGIESEIISCRLGSWMPVTLIAVFNGFDFIGKIIASVPYDWPRGKLVLCSMMRLILVPLMMLCATPRDHPTVSGEFWAMLLSALLGLSNGYFGSVPMILAPCRIQDSQKELTGNIMTMSYSFGLTTGSIIAYLLNAWLGPHSAVDPCYVTSNATASDNVMQANLSAIHTLYDLPASQFFPG